MPCFTPSITIATPMGERAVADLRPGDRVVTRDHGICEIAWTGISRPSVGQAATARHGLPVRITKGSLGGGLPERDMIVSPHHRILVSGKHGLSGNDAEEVLVPARRLVNAEDIRHVEAAEFSYVHFMFARSEVVLANGCWTESFQPADTSPDGSCDAQWAELFELFPELNGIQSARHAR